LNKEYSCDFYDKIIFKEDMTEMDGTHNKAIVLCEFKRDKIDKIWWILE
jgi:hypothetical protein